MISVKVHVPPSVGEWYLDRETEEEFEVVDLDEDADLVEVQYLNGEIGEFDREEWNSLELSKIEPPEDWTVALEPVEEGDVGYDAESFEPSPQPKPVPGFEEESVLRADEEDPHREFFGSDPEDLE
ncbi:MAG: DUF6763 family protein [Bacillota bacterium]